MQSFLIVVAIGAGGGLLFDHFAGPGWLKRQVVGVMPSMITSAPGRGRRRLRRLSPRSVARCVGGGRLVGAALGTAAVLFGWRTVR